MVPLVRGLLIAVRSSMLLRIDGEGAKTTVPLYRARAPEVA